MSWIIVKRKGVWGVYNLDTYTFRPAVDERHAEIMHKNLRGFVQIRGVIQ